MLPAETERVWDFLRDRPELAGMVLIGGTALALHLNHRLSEDLDIACLEQTLPGARLERLVQAAKRAGLGFEPNDNEAAALEFLHGGLNLRDYQQDYLAAGKVKVSFFTPDSALEAVLDRSPSARLRVASLEELFKSKVIVSAKRSKSRDWLDLHILMTQRGFGAKDYFAAFREAGIPSQAEISLARLCSGVPQKDDEGYDHLMPNPPTLGDLKQFFQGLRETEETKAAAAAFGKKLGF